MKIEFNLIKTSTSLGGSGSVLNRQIYNCSSEAELCSCYLDSLSKNRDLLDQYISDESLLNNLKKLEAVDTTSIACINFSLVQNGLEIIYYAVEDNESKTNIGESNIEAIVINTNDSYLGNCFYSRKYNTSSEAFSTVKLFKQIIADFNLFANSQYNIFSQENDPLNYLINALETSTDTLGFPSVSIADTINRTLERLGIKIILFNENIT